SIQRIWAKTAPTARGLDSTKPLGTHLIPNPWSLIPTKLRGFGADGDAGAAEVLLGLGDRVLAEVEDRSRQDGVRAALDETLHQVVERADAARGDHRDRHRIRHGAHQRDVVALAGAVGVDAVEQDLAGAQLDATPRPLDRVHARAPPAAVRRHLPGVAGAPRVD